MSAYYKKLLEQREKIHRLQIFKSKAIIGIAIILVAAIGFGIYYYFSHRDSINVSLVNQEIRVQISPALTKEIQPKIEKFAAENGELKISCEENCEKPDILFATKKDENYAHAELISKIISKNSTYKFKAPDKFIISGLVEIWMMSQAEGKLFYDLKESLKKDYLKDEITLNFVGDIMLSRTVDQKMVDAGDWRLPFLEMASFLKEADLTCGNLESPFFDQGAPVRSGMVFKANPESIAGLKYAGFDILTLANNHFGDQGRAGMLFTRLHLKQNKIDYIGAGKNLAEAEKVLVKEVKGVKIAFIGVENYSFAPESYYAGNDKPGLLHVKEEGIGKYVKRAKKLADVVVVTFHGGTEYAPRANQHQINFAHAAIDAGADVVIGHHPHVVQNVEAYKGKFIIYSLGNFVFDQMWSLATQRGLAVRLTFTGKLLSEIKLVPVRIHNYNQPRIAARKESAAIIQKILDSSDL